MNYLVITVQRTNHYINRHADKYWVFLKKRTSFNHLPSDQQNENHYENSGFHCYQNSNLLLQNDFFPDLMKCFCSYLQILKSMNS